MLFMLCTVRICYLLGLFLPTVLFAPIRELRLPPVCLDPEDLRDILDEPEHIESYDLFSTRLE